MNYSGLLTAIAASFLIGLGFPLVIYSEQFLGYLWWPYMLGMGIVMIVVSLLIGVDWLSVSIGVLGATLAWGATELKEQAVRIGGGNIFRGAGLARAGMDRVTADHMGMLATVMNGLELQDALESLGIFERVLSALRVQVVCEDYIRRRAVRHLEKGRCVIFAAGTGNPFFTTDTAAALRGIEIGADVLLKATKVNGIYDDDPVRNPKAQRNRSLSFDKVLDDRLGVMDATAIVMCRDNGLALRVFNLMNEGGLMRIIDGEDVGTLVANGL